MTGIKVTNHADLRRLLTDYGFRGFPLRKEFLVVSFLQARFDEKNESVIYEPTRVVQEGRKEIKLGSWGSFVFDRKTITKLQLAKTTGGVHQPVNRALFLQKSVGIRLLSDSSWSSVKELDKTIPSLIEFILDKYSVILKLEKQLQGLDGVWTEENACFLKGLQGLIPVFKQKLFRDLSFFEGDIVEGVREADLEERINLQLNPSAEGSKKSLLACAERTNKALINIKKQQDKNLAIFNIYDLENNKYQKAFYEELTELQGAKYRETKQLLEVSRNFLFLYSHRICEIPVDVLLKSLEKCRERRDKERSKHLKNQKSFADDLAAIATGKQE